MKPFGKVILDTEVRPPNHGSFRGLGDGKDGGFAGPSGVGNGDGYPYFWFRDDSIWPYLEGFPSEVLVLVTRREATS